MIVHGLKFETSKALEVHRIFVALNKIFMGSVFLPPCNLTHTELHI